MPSIKNLVDKNQARIAAGGETGTGVGIEDVAVSERAPAPQTPLPPVNVTGLPVRGVFTSNQILATDFADNTTGTRVGLLRSRTFPPVTSNPILTPKSPTSKPATTPVVIPPTQTGQPLLNQILRSGQIDPSQTYFATMGSIPPTGAVGFTYANTQTTLTWSWTGLIIYLANGNTIPIADGSQLITGLSGTTTYNFYPYYDNLSNTLSWVSGGSGTPSYAFTGETAAQILQHSQIQILQQNYPLSGGPMSATTTAGGGGGGGSGGGTKICVHENMLVETRHGIIPIREVVAGDELACPSGWTSVKSAMSVKQTVWVRIETAYSGILVVTPSHHITLADGSGLAAGRLCVEDMIATRGGVDSINSLSVVRQQAQKIKLSCEPDHTFYAGEEAPTIVAHNSFPIS